MSEDRRSAELARIIGNSNSLVRGGYTEALRLNFKNINNISLGSSSISLLGLRAEEALAERGGFIVIDTAVIDHNFHQYVGTNIEQHARIFETFLAACEESDVDPIVLIMPSAWNSANEGLIHQLFRSYQDVFKIPVFDGFAYIKKLCALRPEFTEDADVKAAHLERYLARMLGRSLVQSIEKFRTNRKFTQVRVNNPHAFSTIKLHEHTSKEQHVERTTALIGRTFAILRPGDEIRLEVPVGSHLVGLGLNSCGSSAGAVITSSEGRRVKDFRNARNRLAGQSDCNLNYMAWSLRNALYCPDGNLTIRCISCSDMAELSDVEANEMGGLSEAKHEQLEIATLILLRPDVYGQRRAYEGNLDLVSLLSDDEILSHVASEPDKLERVVGSDGFMVTIPAGSKWREGRDGRIVVIGPDQTFRYEQSGRISAIDGKPATMLEASTEKEKTMRKRAGKDGVEVEIPADASVREGKDGRCVVIPKGWLPREGEDGRIVAVPPGHAPRIGKDGRAVPIAPGQSMREGSDGRLVAIPQGHSWREGTDGRLVAIPPEHSWREGKDGRLVVIPPGQSWREDKSGRIAPLPRTAA